MHQLVKLWEKEEFSTKQVKMEWKIKAKLILFTDFEKAFDKVPHNRLISKLSSYGISKTIIKWIQDFLIASKVRVRVNLSYSAWSDITSGVPQAVFYDLFYFCCLLTT